MHRNPTFHALTALAPLALTAGCASPAGDYPSLAIRDAERVSGTILPPAPAYAPPPSSPAVMNRLEALASAAEQAHAAFQAEAPRTATIVGDARASAAGTENWARAEVALASLMAARSQTMVPLADIDRLYVDAAVEGEALAPIEAVREQVQAQIAEEDAAIARLADMLAR